MCSYIWQTIATKTTQTHIFLDASLAFKLSVKVTNSYLHFPKNCLRTQIGNKYRNKLETNIETNWKQRDRIKLDGKTLVLCGET